MKLYNELAPWWQLMSPAAEYAEEAAFYRTTRENFVAGAEHGGEDAGARGMRWLSWQWQRHPDDTAYFVDYAFLLRGSDGSVHADVGSGHGRRAAIVSTRRPCLVLRKAKINCLRKTLLPGFISREFVCVFASLR